MRKPTISVLLPAGSDVHLVDSVKIALYQTELPERFKVQVSPLRLDETALGVDPWSEIYCPVCNKQEFVTTDHAQVYCDHCMTEFSIGPTSGDPGFCVKARTINADPSKALHPVVIGMELFMIAKNGDDQREWLVKEKHGSVVCLGVFLSSPHFSTTSNCIK